MIIQQLFPYSLQKISEIYESTMSFAVGMILNHSHKCSRALTDVSLHSKLAASIFQNQIYEYQLELF